jgi:Peroxiredoxin
MVEPGGQAPEFAATVVDTEISPFEMSDVLGDGPLVLAFFPAAFSDTCTDELSAFRNDIDQFGDLGATVIGASTDLPHALREYRSQYDLPFDLISDPDHAAIKAYDVVDSGFRDRYGVRTVAQRAVFVIDAGQTIRYRWLADHPGQEPPYDAVAQAVAELD